MEWVIFKEQKFLTPLGLGRLRSRCWHLVWALLDPHGRRRKGMRVNLPPQVLFIVANASMRAEPSCPEHLPEGPTPQHLHWGLGFQNPIFGGHFQTVAVIFPYPNNRRQQFTLSPSCLLKQLLTTFLQLADYNT